MLPLVHERESSALGPEFDIRRKTPIGCCSESVTIFTFVTSDRLGTIRLTKVGLSRNFASGVAEPHRVSSYAQIIGAPFPNLARSGQPAWTDCGTIFALSTARRQNSIAAKFFVKGSSAAKRDMDSLVSRAGRSLMPNARSGLFAGY